MLETLQKKRVARGWEQARKQSVREDGEGYSMEVRSQRLKHVNLEEDHKEETSPGPKG